MPTSLRRATEDTTVHDRLESLAQAIRDKDIDAVMSHNAPDVVVFGIPPRSEVTSHAPEYRDMASTGAAIVVFCTSPEQAADFEDLGVDYGVDANVPARELAAAVRAAYRDRAGHTIH